MAVDLTEAVRYMSRLPPTFRGGLRHLLTVRRFEDSSAAPEPMRLAR